MTIEELLKSPDKDVRLTVGRKWLVWDTDEWSVYEDVFRKRDALLIHSGNSLDEALEILVKE